MDLLALADVDLVATHGGFSQASRVGSRPKATLARSVGELEATLGVRLLERSPRGLRLTEAGVRLQARVVAAPGMPSPGEGDGGPRPLPAIVHVLPRAGAVWTVCEGDRILKFFPRPVLRLSSLPMQRAAVLAGGGAALLPRSLVGQDVSVGRLVRRGVQNEAPPELWVLHTSRRLVDPKVTAFVQFLAAALAGQMPEIARPGG